MSGIYIHIPFCTKACHYCDFHFSTSLKSKERVLEAMTKEISLRNKDFGLNFSSLYFGGGTPSVLKNDELKQIFNVLEKEINLNKLKELTIEINPEDVTKSKLEGYMELGFNRLSLGVQSMDNEFLKWMNRAHSESQVKKALKICKSVGFNNINLDFIYGFPANLNRDYKKELFEIIELEPTHISCYHLTIEKGTYFEFLKRKKRLNEIEDFQSEEEYLWISDTLTGLNYNHYELSNFSKNKYQSFHNSNYWNQQPYIGIGPSAHSYVNNTRRWNISNNMAYCEKINANQKYYEEEHLSSLDIYNEKIMLGLRTQKGVLINSVLKNLNDDQKCIFESKLKKMKSDGLVVINNENMVIPKSKWLMSEFVSRELFILR